MKPLAFVGWAQRSEAHRNAVDATAIGFAALNPSYAYTRAP